MINSKKDERIFIILTIRLFTFSYKKLEIIDKEELSRLLKF